MPKEFLGIPYGELFNALDFSLDSLPIGGARVPRPRQLSESEVVMVQANNEIPDPLKWTGVPAFQKSFPGITGSNQSVVIIDTGVNKSHVDLAGAVILEFDFANNVNHDASDQQGHGSHMAGIIAGRGIGHVAYKGFAPGASIISMKVTRQASDEAAWWSIEQALRMTVELVKNPPVEIEGRPVSAVNLSFNAADNLNSRPYLNHHSIVRDISVLDNLNIPVVISAGNRYPVFKADGVAYPAYADRVLATGAFDDEDSVLHETISYLSQRLTQGEPFDFLLAPAFAFSCGMENPQSYSALMGTSVAAAKLTGLILLMKQRMPGISNAQLRTQLSQHADTINIGASSYRKANMA